ncbi:class I SAM-dependent methyltransferase [Alloacidobacterium dinghuense]|uniref:Class I SAM-dependent methyltransferase n=1 Tax=Alloacidobacterium dinghuense TaxID=2763107 RepID=A0A7G8BKR0_9BACT|nr:class I SAM-dependent methyltransferase [Alloacidobacterium dinghuense]QNI33130.1 class I SAM-dependent methyltransferase [Alloacidobacterium dinghuense]
MKKALARLMRKIVPSTSLLSHNPAFKLLVNSADLLPRAIWREFRALPPNHLRIRIGVGNRFFSNQVNYLRVAESFWLYCLSNNLIEMDSVIVDIGCGCGRFAHHLRDYGFKGSTFKGNYIGIDIDQEMLDWCSAHFPKSNFRFAHSTHASVSYNQSGSSGKYVLPLESESADFVFSTSLFTHLLEPELMNYCEESFRVLRPGGKMLMYFFCLDYPPPTFGGRHTFQHPVGNARVESLKVPEAAVAYTEKFMVDVAREKGFESAQVIAGPNRSDWQIVLLAQKAASVSTSRLNTNAEPQYAEMPVTL